jgi:hypothetical protein
MRKIFLRIGDASCLDRIVMRPDHRGVFLRIEHIVGVSANPARRSRGSPRAEALDGIAGRIGLAWRRTHSLDLASRIFETCERILGTLHAALRTRRRSEIIRGHRCGPVGLGARCFGFARRDSRCACSELALERLDLSALPITGAISLSIGRTLQRIALALFNIATASLEFLELRAKLIDGFGG